MSSPYQRPELMVIGDSLPQGCRSLSVSAEFCADSYPAQATRLAQIPFRVPQHPRPVIFDLEAIAGDVIFEGLPAIFGGAARNYAEWREDFERKAKDVYFDNLAVTGFTLEDTLGEEFQADGSTPACGTSELADAWLAKTPDFDLRKHGALLSDLHTAINARYVLNPGNDRRRRGWSQLDWVADRQPKHLVVHLGHNNGLYAFGSRGDPSGWQRNWLGPAAPALQSYRRIIDRLAADLPVTNVIVIGLPKIGAVSNLMPLGTSRLPADGDYFENYETQFPFLATISGERVRATDAEIVQVNREIEQLVTATGRFSYFSAYDFVARHDTKNTGETPLRVGRYTIDNTYLDGKYQRRPGRPGVGGTYRWVFERGGLQSIDGMHPTSVGDAVLAFELYRLLTGTPLSHAERDRHLRKVVLRERLISQYPQGLDTVQKIVRKYSHGSQSADEQTFNDAIRGLTHVVG